jgi:hypothetical protein
MDSTGPKRAVDSGFLAYRLLYQKRCDEGLKMSYVTTKQRVLLAQYRQKRQEELQNLLTSSYHLGVIRAAKKRIKEINRLVKPDMPIEEAQRLLAEAMKLQELTKRSSEAIR